VEGNSALFWVGHSTNGCHVHRWTVAFGCHITISPLDIGQPAWHASYTASGQPALPDNDNDKSWLTPNVTRATLKIESVVNSKEADNTANNKRSATLLSIEKAVR